MWQIGVLVVLAGAVAGFFLSTFLIILMAIICAGALFVLWLDLRKPSYGTSGNIGLGLIGLAILLFLVPMVVTAAAVRLADLHTMVNQSDGTPEGWFKNHLLR